MYVILRYKGGKRVLCIKAIGGKYYIVCAEILSEQDDEIARFIGGKVPQGRLIIREADHAWVITLPGYHENSQDKRPWTRCNNFAYAQRMLDHAQSTD